MSQLICSNCGSVGTPKTVTKGSTLIEVLLWLFFFIPGVIYSIWRLTTRTKACGSCGAEKLVPLNSPMGKKVQNDFK
ncbi:proteolipid membrane potential modulator [bacterium BMS3Abin07]|nr:proteolipid membrane potential modulator [bacterium BMS3Abin07]GBE31658.1 proteolipid membrane potential modulator [bacterium BMS3Bbin05]HDO22711.1 YqaE/Pmp3 family membrane protein [Nitrospirota bacterium]HDZ88525.1 YqaE/Pmp3 family membrane protein [Nitrospirota bacterium]